MINERKIKNIQLIVHIICILVAIITVFCVVSYKKDPPEQSAEAMLDYQEPMMQGLRVDLDIILQDEQCAGFKSWLLKGVALKEVRAQFGGKKLSILGDSISTYNGWIPDGYAQFYPIDGVVENVNETWWKMFMDDTGMQFCANSSSAGSTCVGDSLSADDPKFACSNYRIDDLVGKKGDYPDIIIVYMGTNDLLIGTPIGENDGTQSVEEGTIETFSDAYSLILDKLVSQYPGAQILCCTLTQVGDWGVTKMFEPFVNNLNLTAKDYSRQIEIIADNKGFDVIDLYNCGITADNMHKYVIDGVHLNTKGMEQVRDAAEEAIIALAQ